ncbi:MAG: toprim domain-containing protein [Magnetococcales bacterium]|nr:toprim domain-containing protein [Magnetococcales bacterium]
MENKNPSQDRPGFSSSYGAVAGVLDAENYTKNTEYFQLQPPTQHTSTSMSAQDPIAAFADVLRQAGLQLSAPPISDHAIHRAYVQGDKKGSRNGWYVLYDDGIPAGAYGNWKEGESGQTWCARTEQPLTEAQRRTYKRRMKTAIRKRDQARKEAHQAAAERAKGELNKATTANPDHPYFKSKAVLPHGVLQSGELLIIPVHDAEGVLQSLQTINWNGGKRFLKGSKKSGGMFVLGKIEGSIMVVEGFATGATVHEATGQATVVAFDAENLSPVIQALRAKYPDIPITICADNDQWTKGNPGVTKAEEIAVKVTGCRVVAPQFEDTANEPTDFNDLAQLEGLNAVCEQLQAQPDQPDLPTPKEIVEQAIEAAQNDPGSPFEPQVIDALRAIREHSEADYQRARSRLKNIKGILISALDQSVKGPGDDTQERESVADMVVDLVKARASLFHDPDGTCYATFEQDGHRETWPLGSSGFLEWVSYLFYKETGKAPRDASLKDALGTLSGIARFDGEEHAVFLRTANHDDGYYIDLCDDTWRAVEVTASGWQVMDHPPVKFRRTKAMRPLPSPEVNGDVSLLWKSINVPKPDQDLVLAWIIESFRPETPKPILEVAGEQGSGKSDTQSRLRDLIDPNDVNLRAAPNKVEDIFVGAANNYMVSFNNLSRLTSAQQDAFCSVSTGGGFGTRQLYTNDEESLIEVLRPVMFNGISTLATAQDLIDRTIRLELPVIQTRRKASDLAEEFEINRASIFGGLLDLFVQTLAQLPHVELDDLPRMADFACLGEALFQVSGHVSGEFSKVYKGRREKAIINALDSSPVARAVLDFMETRYGAFSDTVKGLFEKLEDHKGQNDGWPKSPRGLADILRRNAPALRVAGISVTFDPVRHRDGVHVRLERVGHSDHSVVEGGIEF